MRECAILLNNITLQDHIQDFWRWIIDHGYSVHGTYRFLTSAVEGVIESDINKVWHKLVSKKISLFGWCLLQDRIPTKSNLVRRHILQVNDNFCVGGCGVVETTDHLFYCLWFIWESLVLSVSMAWHLFRISRSNQGSLFSVYSCSGNAASSSFIPKNYLACVYLGNMEE